MADGVHSNTELDATINEAWDMRADEARIAAGVLMPRVLNKSEIVAKSGDKINMTYLPRYATGDPIKTVTAATGVFVPQNRTPTSVQVVVDQWKEFSDETLDRAKAQSFWDPQSNFAKEGGEYFAEHYDRVLFALHTDLTSNVVKTALAPAPFDNNMLRSAMLKLDDRNVPMDDLNWFLPPVAFWNGIGAEPLFVDVSKSGLPQSILMSRNFKFKLGGAPSWSSTLCPTDGVSRIGLLLHKSTFAIALQKNKEIKRAERTAALTLSSVAVMGALYGVKTFREDHGVKMFISAS